jgi:NitT/TauT family transport system substrate-binding protein
MRASCKRSIIVVFGAFCISFFAFNPGRAADVLTATVDGFCICHAPMFVADDLAIFKKHGVEVKLAFPATGFEALAAVGNGSAQIAAAAPGVVAQTIERGTPLTAIFMAFGDATGKVPTDNFMAVVTRKPNGIRAGHIEDLKGRKLGVPRGTIAHQYVFYALAAKGVDAMQDITVQAVPPAQMVGALQNGTVDAIVIWEPVVSQALQNIDDAIVVQRGGNYIQFLDFRVTSPDFLKTNAESVKRFTVAFAEAAQFVRRQPEQTTDILMKHVQGLDRATVRRILGYGNFDPRISKATAAALHQGSEFALKLGALKQAAVFERMVDLHLLFEVSREEPGYFRDLPPIPAALRLKP